jgi:hypothetical protein
MTEEAVVLPKKSKKAAKAEADAAAAETKVEKVTKFGISRPGGPMTAKVWDVADAITKEKGRPALRREVWDRYRRELPKAMESTSNTQYFKWVKFHEYNDKIRELRSGETESDTEQSEADAQPATAA